MEDLAPQILPSLKAQVHPPHESPPLHDDTSKSTSILCLSPHKGDQSKFILISVLDRPCLNVF